MSYVGSEQLLVGVGGSCVLDNYEGRVTFKADSAIVERVRVICIAMM